MGWPYCQGVVWKPLRDTRSHAARQGTLVHSRLSWLSHCGLIFGLKERNRCARADLHFFFFLLWKRRREVIHQTFHHNPRLCGKATTTRVIEVTILTNLCWWPPCERWPNAEGPDRGTGPDPEHTCCVVFSYPRNASWTGRPLLSCLQHTSHLVRQAGRVVNTCYHACNIRHIWYVRQVRWSIPVIMSATYVTSNTSGRVGDQYL